MDGNMGENQSMECKTLQDTIQFAQACAKQAENGDVFMLHGPLGAGKTEFSRAFIRHLTGNDDLEVPSPTFTLVQTYETNKAPIWHFDLYRLEDPQEIYEIGWEEALSDGILLIEWPERLGTLMPAVRKEIIITPTSDESRKIELIHHQEAKPKDKINV